MEFPAAGRESAKKFLEYFLSHQKPPTSTEDGLPVPPNFPTLALHETEAECMDIARTLLGKKYVPTKAK